MAKSNLIPYPLNLKPLIDTCMNAAPRLRSPTGIVHGDFAPWNVIKKTDVRGQRT